MVSYVSSLTLSREKKKIFIDKFQIATCCFAGTIQHICTCCQKSFCSRSICAPSCLTRAVYAILLTFGIIASCLCLTGHVEKYLLKIPHICQSNELIIFSVIFINQTGTTNTCESFVGYSGAYRICFSFTIFHIIMTIILYRIRTVNDYRHGLQNGFWFFKILFIVIIIFSNFLWPISQFNRSMKEESISRKKQLVRFFFCLVVLIIGMVGGFLFIIIQMIFFIDFIYKIIEHWLEKVSNGYQRYTCCMRLKFLFFFSIKYSSLFL